MGESFQLERNVVFDGTLGDLPKSREMVDLFLGVRYSLFLHIISFQRCRCRLRRRHHQSVDISPHIV